MIKSYIIDIFIILPPLPYVMNSIITLFFRVFCGDFLVVDGIYCNIMNKVPLE